mmetsp:Transcript_32598/g.76806  ORF Transcript_32598/g.76806 Transcript_32598/m.76806 type:complete len:83 (+) Transcript_32598:372-620(+)
MKPKDSWVMLNLKLKAEAVDAADADAAIISARTLRVLTGHAHADHRSSGPGSDGSESAWELAAGGASKKLLAGCVQYGWRSS